MAKAERGGCLSNMFRLVRIELIRLAGCDIAEGAGAGADAAQNHHGDMLLGPALADIRARRLFTDGIELQRADEILRFDILPAQRCPNAKPIRLAPRRPIGVSHLLRMPWLGDDGRAIGHARGRFHW